MAKYTQGILGPFTGKLGTVVGTRWRGISVMRSIPASVRNPKTVKQQAQREKFSLVTGLMRRTRVFVNRGFEVSSQSDFTASNAALSYNIRYAVTGEYPGQQIDWEQVRFAMGSLDGARDAAADASEAGKVQFTWTDNSGSGNAKAGDIAMLLVYNEDKQQAVFTTDGAPRSDGSYELTVPADFAGDTLHTWIAFRRFEDEAVDLSSISIYTGMHTAQ